MEMLTFAQVELGLSKAEFWRLTPAVFVALRKRHELKVEREDYRFGTITCLIKAFGGEGGAHPLDDFGKKEREERDARENAKAALIEWRKKERQRNRG